MDGYRTGVVSTDALQAEQIIAFVHGIHRRWESRPRPTGAAPKIPVSEIGGSTVSVGLLAPAGEGEWLREALEAVIAQEGPSREVVIVADPADPSLEVIAAEVCDWATFVDSENGARPTAMANLVGEHCTGMWFALLQPGSLPRPGWLVGILNATKRNPTAGALALPAYQDQVNGKSTALSVSRWGRVLPYRGDDDAADSQVFAVSSRAGVFSRALMEDTGGFDAELPDELADADLAIRALLLGYRCLLVADGSVDMDSSLGLVLAERDGSGSNEARAWARGRVRLLLKTMPRENWDEVGGGMALELLADIFRAVRDGRHPASTIRGFIEGVTERRDALDIRRRQLGRRRVGGRFVREAFVESEAEMASHCTWQRVLHSLSS